MKIAFFVSSIAAEEPTHTTTRLAHAAARLGHDVFYVDAGGFVLGPEANLAANSRRARATDDHAYDRFVTLMKDAPPEAVRVEDLDVLILRNDPPEDARERPWAVDTGIVFGHAAQERGVLVVNSPAGLAKGANKAYLHELPRHVLPRTLIARDADTIKAFAEGLAGPLVLKPLLGAKGDKVFFLDGPDDANLNQVIATIADDGYVVAQEFLEAAREGDVRLFMVDGEPLRDGDRWAAFRRRPASGDLRSNMGAGGTAEPHEIGADELTVAEAIGPVLRRDGMLLVGLDIVGDKLVEVNVQSPGGLFSIERFTGVDFAPLIVRKIEEYVRGRTITATEEDRPMHEDPLPRPDPSPSPPRPGSPKTD